MMEPSTRRLKKGSRVVALHTARAQQQQQAKSRATPAQPHAGSARALAASLPCVASG